MVSGQCEAEASNQSIACEAEAIPIELRYCSRLQQIIKAHALHLS